MRTDLQWKAFGEVDPYFGVVSWDKFHGKLDSPTKAEFFQTGEEHIAHVFERFPNFRPLRTLDFGCGVGRLLRPLAARSGIVIGVDISPAMLAEARKNCADLPNVAVSHTINGRFDFVHSFIVLQHIPPAIGMQCIQQILDALECGGKAALHVTFQAPESRIGLLRRLWLPVRRSRLGMMAVNYVRRKPLLYPFMESFEYRLNRVIQTFYGHGCDHLSLEITDHSGFLGAMIYADKCR